MSFTIATDDPDVIVSQLTAIEEEIRVEWLKSIASDAFSFEISDSHYGVFS